VGYKITGICSKCFVRNQKQMTLKSD
jgi:hypothetical protein